jgi:putative peptidoglycan lipid II flippase
MAALVALGILLSRIAGLIRIRVFAHYFGQQSDAADAFNAAFRIPNFLQNLFGEGALSASFIPVYAALLARGERREADRVAGAVLSLLALAVSLLVLAGVAATPALIAVIAPGFTGDKRALTITLVRILFPGAGLLVLSAWCLGVLNSHRRFLLSYAAPVLWNAAMIATMAVFAGAPLPRLAVWLAWGSVAGSALQVAVQLPAVLRVAPGLRAVFDTASAHVRGIARTFVPVFFSRGVVQISAYIDAVLASLLPTGAVTALANAQLLYTLPVSLFGVSVAAAELPALAGEAALDAHEARTAALRARLEAGLMRIAFYVIPSAVAFLTLGDVIAAAVLQTGRFRYEDALYVWGILAGSAAALPATTFARLYSSAFYALRDTRTPLRYAMVHVGVASALGYLLAVRLPPAIGVPLHWGAAGLTLAAGAGGWIELLLLRRALHRRIGPVRLSTASLAKVWGASVAGAAAGWAVRLALPPAHPVVAGAAVLGSYGLVFLAAAAGLGLQEVRSLLRRLNIVK